MSAGFLALKSQGSQLAVGGEQPYLICSTKDDVKMYDHAKHIVKSLGKHKNVSCLAISATGKYAASVGGDGTLNIYSLENRKKVFTQKICEEEIGGLTVEWLSEGDTLVISGSKCIAFCFEGEDDSFELNYEESVKHESIIRLVKCLKDDVLLTVDVDNKAYVWKFGEEQPAIICSFTTDERIA